MPIPSSPESSARGIIKVSGVRHQVSGVKGASIL
jgi:hypothetical protein